MGDIFLEKAFMGETNLDKFMGRGGVEVTWGRLMIRSCQAKGRVEFHKRNFQ